MPTNRIPDHIGGISIAMIVGFQVERTPAAVSATNGPVNRPKTDRQAVTGV